VTPATSSGDGLTPAMTLGTLSYGFAEDTNERYRRTNEA
jgi:hypothetical protein